MDTLKIDSSQNIDIEQPIASIGERIAATMIDMLFVLIFMAITGFVAGSLNKSWMLVIAYIPVALYSILSELFMNGQSWGKKILKIKVVKIDGTSVTFMSYFLRWIIRMIEVLFTLGSVATLTIILNQKGQRLGDIAANTAVVRVHSKSMKETIYTEVPENYSIVYPEVSLLSTNDLYIIKEVLELLRLPERTARIFTVAKKTQDAIEKKMNTKAGQKPEIFFETILHDYNFLNNK